MAWQISKDGRIDRLVVFRVLPTEGAVPIGQLVFEGKGPVRQSRFAYARSWTERADKVAIDPVNLRLSSKQTQSTPYEVPLPFYDVGPDGWGKQVLAAAYPGHQLGMGELLALGGDDRTGDLLFGPDPSGPSTWVPEAPPMGDRLAREDDLAQLLEAAAAMEEGKITDPSLRLLMRSSADIGGARPKTRFNSDGRSWIAKFPAWGDPFDDPRAEAVCLDIAAGAGVPVPSRRLVTINDRSVLLVERFDRGPAGERHGYISAGTLLREPPATYRTAMTYLDIAVKAAAIGVADARADIFRRMLVNSFVHNTDDHLRNMALIRTGRAWQVAPAFDIVPHRPNRHVLAPAPGVRPDCDPALAFSTSKAFGLPVGEAAAIYDQVAQAAQDIGQLLDKHHTSPKDREVLTTLLSRCLSPPAVTMSVGYAGQPMAEADMDHDSDPYDGPRLK
ncbi:type II toxin-antitoxin system HipA family toxin [Niveispirillum sp. SYP-B3756]|uniref:type II toxin-antitoxin system HipA family toxin n=1 Tax=Niveispirillum sp. SYP-B3756 TaxID=2662178 RepID=UPI00129277B7|nr:HipA domain-containing protein [Niveispirillum sp. SYP-B3756]MQP68168.1 type II toxin-antitoxin system HipA family toxin [Niveispirillum sp. SYP-B3756]